MYIPPKFALSEDDARAALARAGFAHLVTYASVHTEPDADAESDADTDTDTDTATATATGMLVTPLPLLYDATRHSLVGHVARANPHWKAAGAPSVAIFSGPQAYISPTFYPTKHETGKVVPTWNYDVLTVHGHLEAHDDPDWLRDLVERLTERHERDREQPWQVSDAPETYVAGQLRGIVGVELAITSVEGKAKMSQNQPERNRAGVVAGLRASDAAGDCAVADRVDALGNADVVDQA